MRFVTLSMSLILTFNISAQFRDSIDFKYKRLNITLVTSISPEYFGNRFFFFSSDNLLWFSTKQGLTSFDGTEIQNYYPDTSRSIKYGLSKIMAMAEDKEKNLWIVAKTPDNDALFPYTNYTSLLYFNRTSKRITKIDTSIGKGILKKRFIKEILIDINGLLWMSTYEKGIYVFKPTDNTIEYYEIGKMSPGDNDGLLRGIYMTPHFADPDKMWLCNNDGIYLFSLKAKRGDLKYSFPKKINAHWQPAMNASYMDAPNDSTLCIGTEFYGMGVYNIRRNLLTMIPPYATLKKGTPPYPTIQDDTYRQLLSVAKKSAYEYYVYYLDSLPLIFNYHTEEYTQLNNSDPDLKIENKYGLVKLLVDKQDNLWIGDSKYLYVISSEFNLFHLKESPDENTYEESVLYRLVWDKELKKYYASFRFHNQVYQFDSNFQLAKKISTPFPRWSYIKLSEDARKNIWALQPGNKYAKIPSSLSICKKGKDNFESIEKIYPQLSSLNRMLDMTTNNKDIFMLSNAKSDLFFLDTKTFKLDSVAFPKIDSAKQFKTIYKDLQYDSISNCVYVSNGRNIWQYNLETKTSKPFIWDSTMPFKKADVINMSIYVPGQLLVQAYDGSSSEFYIYDQQDFRFKRKIKFADPRIERSSRLQILLGPKPYVFFIHDEGTTLYNYDDNSFRLLDKDNGLLYELLRFSTFTNNIYFSGHNNPFSFQYANFDKLISLQNQRTPLINRLTAYAKNTILLPEFSNGKIELRYDQNTIGVSFSAIEYLFPEKVQYAFRLSELHSDWRYADYKSREILYSNLSPGKYTFQLKAQMLGGNWQVEPIELIIIITPPFWQAWWFRILAGLVLIATAFYLIRWRISLVRKKEQQKAMHQKELLELEAKALRAQMNPHFIFNSMNSIKSLINKNENDKAANYLTTFSKLIRTLFQNSDKREVSLYEELETCKFYTQLEKMRFGDKVEFVFNVDEAIDLKDFKVPALILQPFIENAIWHGLIPKETGGIVTISVKKNDGVIQCIIDDNGIGREQSKQFKPQYEATYQSKGIGLTQSRLELDKLLNEREDGIFIIDKEDENGQSEGTQVIISFKESRN